MFNFIIRILIVSWFARKKKMFIRILKKMWKKIFFNTFNYKVQSSVLIGRNKKVI